MHNREKGNRAEDQAVEYLIQNRYSILDRNYRCRSGEIDCVARALDGTIVFVEVKAGFTDMKGHPFYRVNARKQRRIILVAKYYLVQHTWYGKPCRFDVIGIVNGSIEHLQNAFLVS